MTTETKNSKKGNVTCICPDCGANLHVVRKMGSYEKGMFVTCTNGDCDFHFRLKKGSHWYQGLERKPTE